MFWAILIITGFFILGIGLKKVFTRLCALCFAVSVTWTFGLIFYLTGISILEIDLVALALLMGGSAMGLIYYLSSVLPEKFEVFKLPFLISSFVLFFFILKSTFDLATLMVLVVIWLLFSLLYLLREGRAKDWFKKVVECCKNW